MTAGERFEKWINGLSLKWKDRLRGWFVSWVVGGLTDALEDMLPEQKASLDEALKSIIDDPNTPDYIKRFLGHSTERGNPLIIVAAILIIPLMLIPMVTGAFQPLGNLWNYIQERKFKTFRLDPLSVITAWRRDPAKYDWLFGDLADRGINTDRQDALKFATEAWPSPRDVIAFLAHEVFEKDMIEKYSLLSEWDVIDKEFAGKIGMPEEILKLFWMDHWEHPEWGTIQELRHRDQISDEDVKDWFRLVEIPEYWRPKMLEVLWGLPNRIEIRMMARYLDMSKEEIMALLKKAGLHEDFRADAADFMMIMGLTGYWSDMMRNAWMSPEEVKADIDARGFKPVTAERLYKRLVKNTQPERVAADRNLTMALIVEGVKKGVISEPEGIELLMDLGYDRDEAEYIITVRVETVTGSPENMEQFRDITQKYRKAVGLPSKPVTEELKKAAAELLRLTKDVEALRQAVKEERDKLVPDEVLPEEATARLKELELPLHRAEAELHAAQTDYNALLAEWRHTEAE